jgi:hypothetical protein
MIPTTPAGALGNWRDWSDEDIFWTRLRNLCVETIAVEKRDLPDRYERRRAWEAAHGYPGVTFEWQRDGSIVCTLGGEPLVSLDVESVARMRSREEFTLVVAALPDVPDDLRDIGGA